MSLFLLTFFLIYGSVHLYLFLKIRKAFSPGLIGLIVIALFMLFMIVAPVMVRLAERGGHGSMARYFAYLGYVWMGLLFLFFSASLFIDLVRGSIFLTSSMLKKNPGLHLITPMMEFVIPVTMALMIGVYGFFEAKTIHVEHLSIRSEKIPAGFPSIKVAQISDLHLGLIERDQRLEEVIRIIKSQHPHILISTGDLVDGQMYDLADLALLLGDLNIPGGKFAILGNHEFYAGMDQSLRFLEGAGFRVLRGESVTAGGILNLAGVDDRAGRYFGLMRGKSDEEILSDLDRNRFTLFLKHRPEVDPKTVGLFDLQLSGHTHKGQIFPFNFLSRIYYPFDSGFFPLGQTSSLYVSRGTGTWGPPIRFLSPPEITIITLSHGKGAPRKTDRVRN